MSDPLAHVAPGDSLGAITAAAWNLLVDAAKTARGEGHGRAGAGAAAGDPFTPASIVRVHNTGSSLPVHGIVTPTGNAVDPDTDPLAARRRPVFTVAAPSTANDPILILFEPVAGGAVGRAVAAGVTVATVIVSDAGHRYARPDPTNVFSLVSAESGPAYLLTPPGVGTFKTLVLLGAPPATPEEETATGCAGCGWVAGLTDEDCLTVTILSGEGRCDCDDANDPLQLATEDGLNWTAAEALTICANEYTVEFDKGGCDGPCLTLTPDGGGSPATYTATRDCCGCNYAIFSIGSPDVCTETADATAGPCGNVLRIRVGWSCCSMPGYEGPGWYCAVGVGGDCDDAAPMQLTDEDECNVAVDICAGPYATEEDAQAVCPPAGGTSPADCGCVGEMAANEFRFTISGITNDSPWCFACDDVLNDTFTVSYLGGVSFCAWGSGNIGSWCDPPALPNAGWEMTYDGTTVSLILRNNNTGTWDVFYEATAADWDCVSSITLTKVEGDFLCTGYPSSVTLTPV